VAPAQPALGVEQRSSAVRVERRLAAKAICSQALSVVADPGLLGFDGDDFLLYQSPMG
jgi:hypothetical protein